MVLLDPRTLLAVVPPKMNITVPDLLLSEFQDSFGYGDPDVDNIMHDLRALFVCLCLDDRYPPRRKVTTFCLRYLRFSPHLSFLYASDVRRTANMAELAVVTTLDRTAWQRRSSTVVIEWSMGCYSFSQGKHSVACWAGAFLCRTTHLFFAALFQIFFLCSLSLSAELTLVSLRCFGSILSYLNWHHVSSCSFVN